MDKSQKILSDIVIYNKYAKYIPEIKRRETWEEIISRNKEMHTNKFPSLKNEIEEIYKLVYNKKILPSMRSLQFAGRPIQLNNTRIFNCSYLPIDDITAFSETMFLLLSGTGVGFSVQNHHISKLPYINKPLKTKRYLVADNIEGWSDAIKMLLKAYFNNKPLPNFDFSDIREKGMPLLTAGGKAPGPQPLKLCLFKINSILEQKQNGDRLTSLECHDIICHIADAVLSGGIRRAALISLFDLDDEEMLSCKFGNWWELNPQRGRANNSAMILRSKIDKETFLNLWNKIEASQSGEPGFLLSNDKDNGTNPCAEISLRPFQMCNLTEINVSNIESQEDLNNRAKAAAFIGTLQASYTNFHYLRDIWKTTTEKEALLGIGMTGIASGEISKFNLKEASKIAVEENKRVAKLIGINRAYRVTTVKPSGTSSLVAGCSSGIHAWHSKYYLRRMRIGKNEALYIYLKNINPDLVEDDFFNSKHQAIITIPQCSPDNAVIRENETALQLLERVKSIYNNWVKPGHFKGNNTNNISATINIKPNEWKEVGEWLWENKNNYTALSFLPEDLGTYKQAPFESITKEQYELLSKNLHDINLTEIFEYEDITDLKGELACAGGSCEIM